MPKCRFIARKLLNFFGCYVRYAYSERASGACPLLLKESNCGNGAATYSDFTSVVVVRVTLLLLDEPRALSTTTSIKSNTTPPTTQTVGLFIQPGASAGAVVVVWVSVELVCELLASCANAYTPDIKHIHSRKHFEIEFVIVFFIRLKLRFINV